MIVIWQQFNLSSIIQTCADALIPICVLAASWELGGPWKSHLILFSTAQSCGFLAWQLFFFVGSQSGWESFRFQQQRS